MIFSNFMRPERAYPLQKITAMAFPYVFGLVSLFNGISTLFRLFNAKDILLEEQ